MKQLWNRTSEMLRRHIVLWVPCSAAAILMLLLQRLQKAWIHGLMRSFATQYSVLGGEVPSTDMAQAQHRVMMLVYPVGILNSFLEICFFVVALVATKNLLDMVLHLQRPNVIQAVRGTTSRFRQVLLFSLKYMAVLAVFGSLIGLAGFLLPPERLREFALSKPFVFAFGLVAQGCIAWLLVPTAIRLLRPPGSPPISAQERAVGTIFAIAASAGSFVFEYLVGKIETIVILGDQPGNMAIALVNTIVINVPEIFLFIALALLATSGLQNDGALAMEPGIAWGSRLSDWVRRAREWRGSSS